MLIQTLFQLIALGVSNLLISHTVHIIYLKLDFIFSIHNYFFHKLKVKAANCYVVEDVPIHTAILTGKETLQWFENISGIQLKSFRDAFLPVATVGFHQTRSVPI